MSNELIVYDAFRQQLEAFKAADAEKVFDETTPEGYAACKKYRGKLRKARKGVDDLRLDTTLIYRDKVKNINAEGNGIIGELDVMINPYTSQLDAEDAKEQKVIEDLAEANRLKAEYDEDERLAWLEYRERKVQAAEDAANAIEDAAKEVIEQAKRDEEAAAVTAKAVTDAVLETERKAHEEKGLLAAKQLKEKNDAQAVVDEADKVEAARVADVTHQTNIHLAIKESILTYVRDAANADFLIAAIVDGRIPHIEIVY